VGKKDISKILAKCSARQKTLLLANHVAETSFGEEGLLADSEFNSLINSIKDNSGKL